VFEWRHPESESSSSNKQRDRSGDDMRSFWQLLLPQVDSSSDLTAIVCRRKRKEPKFRFSLDPSRMCKWRNPAYVGKMRALTPDSRSFLVSQWVPSMRTSVPVLEVHMHGDLGERLAIVILPAYAEVNSKLPAHERGHQHLAIELNGTVQMRSQPILVVKVATTGRDVLVMQKPSLHISGKSSAAAAAVATAAASAAARRSSLLASGSARSTAAARPAAASSASVAAGSAAARRNTASKNNAASEGDDGADDDDDDDDGARLQQQQAKYMLEIDFPLTIFVAFALSIAVEEFRAASRASSSSAQS
jgi:hypothetical protein